MFLSSSVPVLICPTQICSSSPALIFTPSASPQAPHPAPHAYTSSHPPKTSRPPLQTPASSPQSPTQICSSCVLIFTPSASPRPSVPHAHPSSQDLYTSHVPLRTVPPVFSSSRPQPHHASPSTGAGDNEQPWCGASRVGGAVFAASDPKQLFLRVHEEDGRLAVTLVPRHAPPRPAPLRHAPPTLTCFGGSSCGVRGVSGSPV